MKRKSVLKYLFIPILVAPVTPQLAWAQATSPSAPILSPGAPASPTKPAHESDGLLFAIASVHVVNNDELIIEYAVQNVSKFRKYILLYGSSVASLDSGASFYNNIIQGISHCFFFTDDDAHSLQACQDASNSVNPNGGGTNIQNYTYIEPGDVAAASISYNYVGGGPVSQAQTANFAFMALVRTSNGTDESLEDSSESAGAGPTQVVNVNFPFVPIQ